MVFSFVIENQHNKSFRFRAVAVVFSKTKTHVDRVASAVFFIAREKLPMFL